MSLIPWERWKQLQPFVVVDVGFGDKFSANFVNILRIVLVLYGAVGVTFECRLRGGSLVLA